jgi:predicted house-cleaning NTP pyrophosphatase (Maf/HAM1 superfamily)
MKNIIKALIHKDILGAGAKRRNELNLNKDEEFEVIIKEFKRGTLHSGSGNIVKNISQAKAIAISELRKRGKY